MALGTLARMEAPDVFAYDDHRHFLEDWFHYQKANRKGFSHRWLARRVASTDPSVLANVISGRRPLTAARVPDFARALELEGPALEYFAALVARDGASHPEVRQRAEARVRDLRRRHEGPNVPKERYGFFSRWYYAAIVEMSHTAAFRAEAGWVAGNLEPELEEDEAAEALEQLKDWGFLVETPSGWVSSEEHHHTDTEVKGLGNMGQHLDLHEIAGGHLLKLSGGDLPTWESTTFLTTTVAIPSGRTTELRERLFQLLFECAELAEGLEGEKDRVVQISLQAFPLSKGLWTAGR